MSEKTFLFFKTKSNDSFEFVEAPCAIVDDTRVDSRPYAVVDRVHNRQESVDEDIKLVTLPTFEPMNHHQMSQYFDADGRVVAESKLRESLFHGGCDGAIRRHVWSFVFGLYPVLSTERERMELKIENHYKYHALKMRCQSYMKQCEDTDVMSLILPPPDQSESTMSTLESHEHLAKLFAGKQEIGLVGVADWYKVIGKDIPRTDTDHQYFRESDSDYAEVMKNILLTFGFYHPRIGYVQVVWLIMSCLADYVSFGWLCLIWLIMARLADYGTFDTCHGLKEYIHPRITPHQPTQGMNDVLTRFMVVMGNEVDAYWTFHHYMERMERDFDENGMVEKLNLVRELLADLEPNLYSHLCNCNVSDLLFCHRWLLVSFKREFEYEESIRYFEMVHSQHLELDSPTGMSVQDTQRTLEVLKEGESPEISGVESKFTFEVFVCVAVIMLKRHHFLACKDAAEVFHVACNIRGTLDLQKVHAKSYAIFHRYCRKSVSQQFAKVEKPNFIDSLGKLFKTKLF